MKTDNSLVISNLHVKTSEDKKILNGIDLEIKKGEVYALLGPNGCGKSTLANTILGNPKYTIAEGKITFNGKILNGCAPEQRVKLGIALAFQHPPAIKGVPLGLLLEVIAKKDKIDGEPKMAPRLLPRDVNLDYSGGEKKLSELVQILSLKPKLAIFDELDSGLDVRNLKKLADLVKKEFIAKNVSLLIITHSGRILELLKPDITCVMVDGKIICRNKNFRKILTTINKYGYEKCKKCPFLAG